MRVIKFTLRSCPLELLEQMCYNIANIYEWSVKLMTEEERTRLVNEIIDKLVLLGCIELVDEPELPSLFTISF